MRELSQLLERSDLEMCSPAYFAGNKTRSSIAKRATNRAYVPSTEEFKFWTSYSNIKSMNFENPKITNPEYKEVKAEDVVEKATQELVDEALRGAGQDFIERRRPHLVQETRKKVAKIYEDSKEMFENFSGDVSGDTTIDMVNRRAEVLANLFEQSEMVDVSAGGEILDGEFSKAISEDGFAVSFVMQNEGKKIDEIADFPNKVKNAKALLGLFKNQDQFSYSKFQEALIADDLDAALQEFENFRKRQLGEGVEENTA